jgi:ribonuclease P/MRP protein subunit RPP1
MRAPRDIEGVGATIGFEAEEVAEGLRRWGELVARNRQRQSSSFVEPGAWVESDEGGE